MTDLLIKIKMLLEGQAAAAQAAAAARQVGDASETASAKGGGLGAMFSTGMGRAAAFGAVLTGGLLVGVTVVTAAFSAFTGALRESMAAAAESESSALKLNQALANTGQFSRDASDAIQALAAEQQRLTNVSDETWQESAAKLLQYGAAVEDIPQYTKIIEDLAGRLDGDVPRATQAFIGAMIGTRTELTKMGLDVDKNATKQERLAAIMAVAATGAGQLRAETQTLGGGWKSILVAAGDAAESLGKLINTGGVLTGIFRGVAGAINAVNGALGNMPDITQKSVKNRQGADALAGSMGEVKAAADGAADGLEGAGSAAESAGNQAAGAADQFKSLAEAAATARQAADEYADNQLQRANDAIDANPLLDDGQKKSRKFDAEQASVATKIKSAQTERDKLAAEQKQSYDAARAAQEKADAARRAAEGERANFRQGIDPQKADAFEADPLGAVDAARQKVEDEKRKLLNAQKDIMAGGGDPSAADASGVQDAKAALTAVEDLAEAYKAVQIAADAAARAEKEASTAQAAKTAATATLEPKINRANDEVLNLQSAKAAAAAQRQAEIAAEAEKKSLTALEKRLKLQQTLNDATVSQMEAQGATDDAIAAKKQANLKAEYELALQIAAAKKEDSAQIDADYQRDLARLQAEAAGRDVKTASSGGESAGRSGRDVEGAGSRAGKRFGTDGIEIGQGSKNDPLYAPGSRIDGGPADIRGPRQVPLQPQAAAQPAAASQPGAAGSQGAQGGNSDAAKIAADAARAAQALAGIAPEIAKLAAAADAAVAAVREQATAVAGKLTEIGTAATEAGTQGTAAGDAAVDAINKVAGDLKNLEGRVRNAGTQ